eukprot:jgi/Tetstr1/442592/TSEL_030688.t1
MRIPIEINSRVAARRGPFEPAALGTVRQQRALKFGNVVESVASNKFRIRWDDGTESCETTNVLKLQPTGASALSQLRHFEIQEGRDAMRLKEHAPEMGVTAACTLRMAERSAPAGANVLGDSWFAFVKTSHSLYAKAYMESHVKDKPAGSRMVLRSIDEDMVSQYFARSPRVHNHNQSRRHDLMLEELWMTHDRWFRLHTIMAGIHVTDCWKLAKHHLPRHHLLKESTVVNFADLMCKARIHDGLTGEVEPTRMTERVLADITTESPPVPHSIMYLGKRPGSDNATKQARCTMCRVDDDNVGWTSYKCPDCDIPPCIPSKRRKGVACWTRHRRMTGQELAVYIVNRSAD